MHPTNPTRQQSNPLIQCLQIHKSYVRDLDIFRGATLRINAGDFLFLIGASGSGKSTLFRLILGLEQPSEGNILIDGCSLQHVSAKELPYLRRRMGVVFQDLKLLMKKSVHENVALPLEATGKGSELIRTKVPQIVRFIGLDHKIDAPCMQLSGSERRRVAIGRAIANDPAVLLADEPMANLDDTAAGRILELLGKIHRRGTTVVVAAHDLRVAQMAPESRAVMIDRGRIIEMGMPSSRSFLTGKY